MLELPRARPRVMTGNPAVSVRDVLFAYARSTPDSTATLVRVDRGLHAPTEER